MTRTTGRSTTGYRGAVGCGHPTTAAAAREVLAEGGNAFDAAIAAFWAACVAEPVFCSLGGGGFLLARRTEGEALLYDFFVETPLERRPVEELEFYPIDADFGTATQEFHIGLGAAATPGAVKGLFLAHRQLARLPMPRLVEPAVRAARQGVELRDVDSFLFGVVAPILVARAEGRALYARPDGQVLRPGDSLRQPDLAATIEALAREGEELFYEGEIGRRLVRACNEQGGQLSAADLAAYQVEIRQPLERSYRDCRILTNPPPSSGGILIAFALELLKARDLDALAAHDAPDHFAELARVMTLTNKARVESRLHEALAESEEAAAAARLLDPGLIARYAAEVAGQPSSNRGTTHLSVVDAEGNIAALSLSNGEGCGFVLPETGIMINNMLGEEDINPQGFHCWPTASRISSMMSPTVAFRADGSLAAFGSGGSNRIRTAILQVLLNLIDFDLPIDQAVEAPRLHVEGAKANLEGGLGEDVAAAVAPEVSEVLRWPQRNLFFGGVHAVTRSATGEMRAAGDPRRGGVAVVV